MANESLYKGDGDGDRSVAPFKLDPKFCRVGCDSAFGSLKARLRLSLHIHRTSWKVVAQSVMAKMALQNSLDSENYICLPNWAKRVEELEDERGLYLELPN